MAKTSTKPARKSGRGNNVLQAQALALSMHTWNNTPDDWARLEEAVTRLGASAPKAAKAALASYRHSMSKLPNPFATVS